MDSVAVVHSLARGEGKWVLLVTILGSGMAFIDSTAMNVVLPVLQLELNATIPQMQWIVEAYAIFMSSLMLLGGALGDKFGRKRMFALGVVIFSLASIWCGVAPSTGHLIVARAFQGVGGALLVPGSLAIVNVSFSEKERGRAFGTWSAFTAMTTALGPILGGWLAESVSCVSYSLLTYRSASWFSPRSCLKSRKLKRTTARASSISPAPFSPPSAWDL